MFEDDRYIVDFKRMLCKRKMDMDIFNTAANYEHLPWLPLMKLDDCLYVGNMHTYLGSSLSWHYMGRDRKDSLQYCRDYMNFLLEKATWQDADEA